MNVFKYISNWFTAFGRAFRSELKTVVHDPGVLLFFFALPLAYPVVYTLIYNPEVVREIPIAVVDDSRTPQSRELVQKADASPSILLYDYAADKPEARNLMAEGKVFGIMTIPSDYAKSLARGETAHVEFYSDMSLLLRYRAFMSALTDLQLDVIGDVTSDKVGNLGAASLAVGGMPVKSESNFLGDTEQGFASFVIPGIVILILQQSMLLGITLIGGTRREKFRFSPPDNSSATARVWGRAMCYVLLYVPMAIYVLRYIPEMFNLPHYGAAKDYLLFIFPMLLGTAFLGQALNLFMKERESAFIIIVFTSVVFLFLSGLTWPRYAMNQVWTWVGNCVPAVWGVEGFIRINSNAASLAESAEPFKAMWILSAIYMLAAIWVTKYLDLRHSRVASSHNGRN